MSRDVTCTIEVRIRGRRRLLAVAAFWATLRKLRIVSADYVVARLNAAIARCDTQVRLGGEWVSLGPPHVDVAKVRGRIHAA